MGKMRLAKGSTDVVLREEWVGAASNRICYPSISSCIAVTGVGPSGMVGAHITVATEPELVDQIFQTMRTGGSSCPEFYVIGAISAHFKPKTVDARINSRKKISQMVQKMINGQAAVRFYDTSSHGDAHIMAEKNLGGANFYWIASAGHMVMGDAYPNFPGRTQINSNLFVVR
jgi:hypothetical protein